MQRPTDKASRPGRLATRIPGFDTLLAGGLVEHGVYFVQGPPGAGKTTLANQLCFCHAAAGHSAVYVTLLADSHARMVQNLEQMGFTDRSLIDNGVYYISGFRALAKDGLRGLTALISGEIRARKASVLVIDGLVIASEAAGSDSELRMFVHELQSVAALLECTMLLLTSEVGRHEHAERTMVDGIIQLVDRPFGSRMERRVQVTKLRGNDVARGEHSFCITHEGLTVYPRLETVYGEPVDAALPGGVVPSGIPGVDALIHAGGLPRASATLLEGAGGAGKTTAALQFLDAAGPQEPVLWIGFGELPGQLLDRAGRLGLKLAERAETGRARLHWSARESLSLDQMGHELLNAVEAMEARRVVVDSIEGFRDTPAFGERGRRFLACLVGELRRRDVTALFTAGRHGGESGPGATSLADLAALFDNHAVLRSIEAEGSFVPDFHVVKVRNSGFDATLRVVEHGEKGLVVGGRRRAGGSARPK